MTFTRVQSAVPSPTFSSSFSATLGSTPGQGNLLLAWFSASQTLLSLSSSGWNTGVTALEVVGAGVYWKVAGASEPSTVTWTNPGGGNVHAALGVHEYAGNTMAPYDTSGFAYVYFDSGAASGPAFSITPGAQHELIFALEALRNPTAASTIASATWTGGLSAAGISTDGISGAGIVAGVAGDLLDTGTSLSAISVAPAWPSPTYKERTTLVLAFASVAGSGLAVADSETLSGADASLITAHPSDSDNVGQVSFDGGEVIVQTGPYPTSDSFHGSDAAGLARADTDAMLGTDLGVAQQFVNVFVFSADASQKPTSSIVSDADRGGFTEGSASLSVHQRGIDSAVGQDT